MLFRRHSPDTVLSNARREAHAGGVTVTDETTVGFGPPLSAGVRRRGSVLPRTLRGSSADRRRGDADVTADPSLDSRLDDVLRTLAGRVRRLREDRDLSLVELSFESGLSESRLRAIEAGRTTASLATLVALAETFEIGVSELFAEPASERSVADAASSGEVA
ncbi:hypothetical protein DBR36_14075 [Microbacterium sp. HMWF026]|nr:hypothetical protein DBR36_14075 [Microbacterium sp. HMWF026]